MFSATSMSRRRCFFAQAGSAPSTIVRTTAAGATGTVGPDLDKVAADAQKAGTPLAAYVKQSIVDPSAYVAPGYSDGIMPKTFGNTLSSQQVAALVRYLTSSR